VTRAAGPSGNVLLGAIIGAHGLKGEVKVKTFTSTPESLAAYGALLAEDGRRFKISELRALGADTAIVCFEGIKDRNSAESLKGVRLSVAREALPEPEDNEFYHADLIGLRAETRDGALLGRVKGLHNFGAGDVLEITDDAGAERFVPFTEDVVPEIDVPGGRIVVELPCDDETS
jgi:16S rRNA processing protein RimM